MGPMAVELELLAVVPEPNVEQKEAVDAFARDELDYTDSGTGGGGWMNEDLLAVKVTDENADLSSISGLGVNILMQNPLYFKHESFLPDYGVEYVDNHSSMQQKKQEVEDQGGRYYEVVEIYYAMWVLENGQRGNLFKTNKKDIADAFGRDSRALVAEKYNSWSTANNTVMRKATSVVFRTGKIRYASKLTIVSSAYWGYDVTEEAPTAVSTQLQPYTPIIIDIWVEPFNLSVQPEFE